MKFLKQIKNEIRNILKSKFLLIMGIIVLTFSIAIPVIGLLTKNSTNTGGKPIEAYDVQYAATADSKYYNDGGTETITVDGVVISSDNPFYWNVKSTMEEKESMQLDQTRFSTPEVLDLAVALLDEEINYYVHFAKYVSTYEDYRAELAWSSIDNLYDKFIYEHIAIDQAELMEAVGIRKYLEPADFSKKYYEISEIERQEAYSQVDQNLTMTFTILENSDFPQYIELRIRQSNATIADLEKNIAVQEQAIVDNPSQEDAINNIIEDLRKQITTIEESTIPILEYRLEKNIVPGEDNWQNSAISDLENNRNQLIYITIMSEEDFNLEQGMVQQYKTYQKYVQTMQAQINAFNRIIVVAQKSLDAEKPDMKYVPDGARIKTVQFLNYSVIVGIFAVLIGGWIIASEFQQGTIRLLMIRPKTRIKILMSKFFAAIAIILSVYLMATILNIITNGLCFGFSDYAFPNFSVAGAQGFLGIYVPMFLACIIPILFVFALAFMLSVLTKNIAVSIIIPIICYIGCFLTTSIFAYQSAMEWIAYTPIPFVMMPSFFISNSVIQAAILNGYSFSIPYGIALLLLISAVCAFISIRCFQKRDIAN